MIFPRALTAREQATAQNVYRNYIVLESLARGSFSGLTLQVLLGVQLGLSTTAVSCIGSLEYLKYFALPLGFVLAGRLGLCSSMRFLATMIGLTCLLLASSAVIPIPSVAVFLFFAALIVMYASIACNAAMMFPLQKNITTDATLPRMISRNQIASSGFSLAANLAIAGLFACWSGPYALPLLFVLAAVLYFLNGRLILRLPEPSILKELAARPILPQVREAWGDKLVRRQLIVGFTLNMVFITMIPANILVVKKGCGTGNMEVLLLTTIQLICMIPASKLFQYVTERFGPRKMMIFTSPVVWSLAAYWCLVPVEKSFLLMVPPFMLASIITMGYSSAMGSYFVMAVPNHLQVGGSFLIFLIHGGLVGLVGVIANPLLFQFAGLYTAVDSMEFFRLYYLITGVISLLFILAPISLPVKHPEKQST